jgi:hypothetical protein
LHIAGCTLVTGRPAPAFFFTWKFNNKNLIDINKEFIF